MKWCMFLWIACLWACNPNNEVTVSGSLLNYKGNKLFFEICGQDTTIASILVDALGALVLRPAYTGRPARGGGR